MKKLITGMLAFVLLLSCTGCATFLVRAGDPGEHIYPATQGDISLLHQFLTGSSHIFERSYPFALLTLIDIPMSLATDTVFLPFDLLRCHEVRKEERERKKRAEAEE